MSSFYSSSFNVIPVSINGSRRVRENVEEVESCTDRSLLDVYANRHEHDSSQLLTINFVKFAALTK